MKTAVNIGGITIVIALLHILQIINY